MKQVLIGVLAVSVVFSSCLKTNNDIPPCNPAYNACAFVVPASETTALETYLSSQSIANAQKHCSGMYYKIDSVASTGATPDMCSTITMKYKGQLTNGTVFEDTYSNPLTILLGQLIGGFRNCLPLIKAGSRIHLYIPPSLGYGNQAVGNIPPGSILIFQVDLVAVQ